MFEIKLKKHRCGKGKKVYVSGKRPVGSFGDPSRKKFAEKRKLGIWGEERRAVALGWAADREGSGEILGSPSSPRTSVEKRTITLEGGRARA